MVHVNNFLANWLVVITKLLVSMIKSQEAKLEVTELIGYKVLGDEIGEANFVSFAFFNRTGMKFTALRWDKIVGDKLATYRPHDVRRTNI